MTGRSRDEAGNKGEGGKDVQKTRNGEHMTTEGEQDVAQTG